MKSPEQAHSERVLTALLLMGLVIAGVALLREGAHFDNTIGGERLFISAFFVGGIIGFLAWTRYTGITPMLTFKGPSRLLWLATLVAALVCASGSSYANRAFATPTAHSTQAQIDSILEGKGERWHLIVANADGGRQRYLITSEAASRLKNAKTVRMHHARGALGFDYIASFEAVN